MSLSGFKGKFASGPQFANQFEVEIPDLGDAGTFLCHQVTLPGYSAALAGTIMYGKAEEVPYQISMVPVQVTAYLDSGSSVPKKLDAYKDKMFDMGSFSPEFWTKCMIDTIKIKCLDKNGATKATYMLSGCILSDVTSGTLSWGSQNQIAEVNFTISYQKYSVF
jgi:hypothetical protein